MFMKFADLTGTCMQEYKNDEGSSSEQRYRGGGQRTRLAPWVCAHAHPGGPILPANAPSLLASLKIKYIT